MPRANRHYIPGHIWHMTHRCHKKEFLLKFGRDRRRWMAWLYEARKRYGVSGFNDIRNPRMRYTLIDYKGLMNLLGFESLEAMKEARCQWIEEALVKNEKSRESKWTESIAVGSKGFVERTKEFLGIKVKDRKVMNRSAGYELRDPAVSYNLHFDPKNRVLRPENTYFWRD